MKVCVITGGGSGMGLETARLMGENYKLLLCGRSMDKLKEAAQSLESQGIYAETMTCDVSDIESVSRLAHYAKSLGPISAVIHCAGLSPSMGSAKQIIAINALGTININNAFFDVMENEGCIIDVSSMSAYLTPQIIMPKWLYKEATLDPTSFIKNLEKWISIFPKKHQSGIAYGITKNFVIWFAKQDAARFGRKGVRVLSVSPGNFETPMGDLEKKEADEYIQYCAIKRYGKVEEIACLFDFCASSAPSYLTGIDIICDGGLIASGVSPFAKSK